jgi:hypothetical protein
LLWGSIHEEAEGPRRSRRNRIAAATFRCAADSCSLQRLLHQHRQFRTVESHQIPEQALEPHLVGRVSATTTGLGTTITAMPSKNDMFQLHTASNHFSTNENSPERDMLTPYMCQVPSIVIDTGILHVLVKYTKLPKCFVVDVVQVELKISSRMCVRWGIRSELSSGILLHQWGATYSYPL